jgi:hypothetical protein
MQKVPLAAYSGGRSSGKSGSKQQEHRRRHL